MSSRNQPTSPHGAGSGHTRWIVIAAVVAVIVIGVVLLAANGGAGSAPGY